jgi:hypothetical protein
VDSLSKFRYPFISGIDQVKVIKSCTYLIQPDPGVAWQYLAAMEELPRLHRISHA